MFKRLPLPEPANRRSFDNRRIHSLIMGRNPFIVPSCSVRIFYRGIRESRRENRRLTPTNARGTINRFTRSHSVLSPVISAQLARNQPEQPARGAINSPQCLHFVASGSILSRHTGHGMVSSVGFVSSAIAQSPFQVQYILVAPRFQ